MGVLFVCDVDGTLVRGSLLSERAVDSLNCFVERGNYLSLATGRNAFAIKWIEERVKINAPCILLTGAQLYNSGTCKRLNIKPMDNDVLLQLQNVYDSYPDMGIQVFTGTGLKNLRQNRFLKEGGIKEERELGESALYELQGEDVLKIGLCCEDVSKIEEAIGRFFYNTALYNWHYSFHIGAEVFNPSVSKGCSVRDVISLLPEKPSLVAVAGDSPNDLSMFECADIRFAPETSFDEVKKKADFIISDPEEGGIADALAIIEEIKNKR